jgi:nicotinate phosphoribosyltransferase
MLDAATALSPSFSFVDFGTRRRAERDWHEEALLFTEENYGHLLGGTSNMHLARKYNLQLKGTMSHQYLQAFQQLAPNLVDFQKTALQTWADEYRGELGIALSDVIGFRAFLKDFDKYFAKLFDGCRHDSGNPFWWCEELIEHYKKLGIDPKTKHALFSDGLTFDLAIDLFRWFHTQINTGPFCIGTNFTNDCGFIAPQIVIKMVECCGRPVAKMADSAGKDMCEDDEFARWLRRVIDDKIGLRRR